MDIPLTYAFDVENNRYVFYRTGTAINSYYVIDATTGTVISQKNSNQEIYLLTYGKSQTTGTYNIDGLTPPITVFPNPVNNGSLNFNYNGSNKNDVFEITIFDLLGKKIMRTVNTLDNAINVSELKQGVYFIRVSNNNINFIDKFFVE